MIIDLNTAEKVPFALDGRFMYSSEKVQLVHLTIQPGEVIEAHSNPFDVVFYVLEGEAVVNVNDEELLLSENQTLDIAADVMRGCKNASNEVLRLLVIKIF